MVAGADSSKPSPFVRAAKAPADQCICTGSPEPSSQCQNLMCWLKWRLCAIDASSEDSGESAYLHRLA